MRNKKWRVIQGIQLLIFLLVSIFLFVRNVDGHGAIQTIESKTISFLVWLAFYALILIIESVICFFKGKNKKEDDDEEENN